MKRNRYSHLLFLLLVSSWSCCFAQGTGSWGQGFASDAFAFTLVPVCIAFVLMMTLGSAGRGSTVLTICSVIFCLTLVALLITGWIGLLVAFFIVPWILVLALVWAIIFGSETSSELKDERQHHDLPPPL